jgi:multisubunit Na+/H+ antiporter MnhE subunit
MTATVTAWVLLWAVYLTVLGDARPGDLVIGAAVAAAVLAACRPFLVGTRPPRAGRPAARVHPTAVPGLLAATVVEILRGTIDVVRVVFAPSRRAHAGIVELPLPDASPAAITTLALTLTLSPGSAVVDIDRKRRVMRVHVVDARDPERARDRLADFDRRWRRPAVE